VSLGSIIVGESMLAPAPQLSDAMRLGRARRRARPNVSFTEPYTPVSRGLAQLGEHQLDKLVSAPGAMCGECPHSGQLDLSARTDAPTPGWSAMPEIEAISTLTPSNVTGRALRHFLTFTMALDRARDSTALWNASARLFNEHSLVFEPSEVTLADKYEVGALLREYSVSQRHGPDCDAWLRIAHSLTDRAAPEINIAIETGAGDAADLLEAVQRIGHDGTTLFPLLRGQKIAPVWVRILVYPGKATLSSLETVSIAVDVHTRRVTENLGLTATAGEDLERGRGAIQDAWAAEVQATGAAGPPGLENTPAALDPALWFFGKWGCSFCETQGQRVPIADACGGCRL